MQRNFVPYNPSFMFTSQIDSSCLDILWTSEDYDGLHEQVVPVLLLLFGLTYYNGNLAICACYCNLIEKKHIDLLGMHTYQMYFMFV